jgi:hypothetical protein
MIEHLVDPAARDIDGADLATWVLFFLEAHGAAVTLRPGRSVSVDLNSMSTLVGVGGADRSQSNGGGRRGVQVAYARRGLLATEGSSGAGANR